MAYCTKADLLKEITEEQLIQLTDDDDNGVENDDIISEKIADADSLIDGYCGKRYTVPFTTVPKIVKNLSVQIAIYNLFKRRQHVLSDEKKEDYKNALQFLRDIEAGKISLGVPAPAENPDRIGDYDGNDRLFTRDNMEGF